MTLNFWFTQSATSNKITKKQTKKHIVHDFLVAVAQAAGVTSVLQANIICVVAYLSANLHSNCGVAAWHGTSPVWPWWYISISFIT